MRPAHHLRTHRGIVTPPHRLSLAKLVLLRMPRNLPQDSCCGCLLTTPHYPGLGQKRGSDDQAAKLASG